ncbi:MAG: nucleotidyltransferase family protein [Polyangia bacterium]
MTAPVAILAGGLATRLRPITETIPKSLVDVCGEPFVSHQLRMLQSHGITDVVLCVGYRGEQIEQVVGAGSAFGLRVRYAFDGERLLGTGGAVRRALHLLGDEFFVLYGDSYLACDYQAVLSSFRASGKLALMTVYRNDGQHDTSNVEYDAGTIRRYDKSERSAAMHHIDYGLGVFRRMAFADVLDGAHLDLAKLYQTLLAGGQLAGYELTERFYEIGSVAGLQEFRALMENRCGAKP